MLPLMSVAELQTDDRDDRNQRVRHDMPQQHLAAAQSLGDGGDDELLLRHVDDRASGDARDDAENVERQGRRRQDEIAQRMEEEIGSGRR